MIITVPAYQSLWSYFDEASHYCRRYEVEELKRKIEVNDFHVEYLTHYMSPLLPLMWLGRKLAALFSTNAPADLDQINELAAREPQIIPVVNDLLSLVLRFEAHWIALHRRLPIGTSLLTIARKIDSK